MVTELWLSELNLHSEEISDLIYPSFHVHADSAGALIQHGPLRPVVKQPSQAHPLLLSSRQNILKIVLLFSVEKKCGNLKHFYQPQYVHMMSHIVSTHL